MSVLPPLVGLCPEHAPEFYMPLWPGDSTRCPEPGCDQELVIYAVATREPEEART